MHDRDYFNSNFVQNLFIAVKMPRKQAFSGKQKKQQLQAKKEKKQSYRQVFSTGNQGEGSQSRNNPTVDDDYGEATIVARTNTQGIAIKPDSKFFENRPAPTRQEAGRYALMFRAESKAEVMKLKEEARKSINPVLEEYLECTMEDFFSSDLDFPVRPKWDYNISREQLERNEQKYFQKYLQNIEDKFDKTDLSYFELNLETWRQFWRVLEMSDILLCIVDIRFPAMLFPPKLYEYICKDLGKQLVVVLNKIDICPAPLVLAWKEYFMTKYPELKILCFTSFPSYNLHGNQEGGSIMKAQKRRGKMRMAAEGAMELYKVCEEIVQDQVNLKTWKEKIMEEINTEDEEEDVATNVMSVDTSKPDSGYYEFKKYNGGILTIGCVGQPNVGKSSLINAIMGRKVVSVSKTPGHTKHFQTIFLTSNVRLCDCPGLIFPSKVPKPLQVLCGSYPIAQLREPYSTVKYLAERIDLPKLLRITHPEGDTEWCAYDVADGWAQKRGYFTAKAARLDSYRGANHLLRLALEGKICICLRPPLYTRDKEKWSKDVRVAEIVKIQAKFGDKDVVSETYVAVAISDDEDEEEGETETEKYGKNATSETLENSRESESDEEQETDDEEEKRASSGKNFSSHNKFAMLEEDG